MNKWDQLFLVTKGKKVLEISHVLYKSLPAEVITKTIVLHVQGNPITFWLKFVIFVDSKESCWTNPLLISSDIKGITDAIFSSHT